AAAIERSVFVAVSARRLREIAGRDLDDLQPERHARRNQRSDQRRTERFDRVPENVMKTKSHAVRTAAPACPVERSSTATARVGIAGRALLLAILVVLTSPAFAQDIPMFHWQNFTASNGLPDNHVYCVLVDGGRVWAGTDNGLGLLENGKWTVFRPHADAK